MIKGTKYDEVYFGKRTLNTTKCRMCYANNNNNNDDDDNIVVHNVSPTLNV